jgi:hypothetical protein
MRQHIFAFALGFASLCAATTARADVIAHYRFDETSGTTAAPSIGSVNGTLQGSASFVTGGISGNAVSLSTTNDGVVSMGNNFRMLTGNFSISFWVKTNTVEADSVMLSKHSAGFTNGYLFPVGPTGGGGAAGKANFTVSENVANGVTSTTTVNDNAWHNIVGVYTAGGTHSIYVDGAPAEETKGSAAVIDSVSAFYVGGVGTIGNPTVADGRYTGLFDDLQIYNQALTDSQVSFIFANPGQVVPEPSGVVLLALSTALLPRLSRRRRAR